MKALYVILPDDLYIAIKSVAFEEGLTLKKLMIKIILKYLKEKGIKNE
jgi:hypothetical protein